MKLRILIVALSILLCDTVLASTDSLPSLVILGVAQDAGYPQAGCKESCCTSAWKNPKTKRWVTSLALVDPVQKKWWLFEATPDFKEQLRLFEELTHSAYPYLPEGIFLTHGHMGHYSGLMQLGREALNAKHVQVYAMPRMKTFLTDNGPWSQLVQLGNITLIPVKANEPIHLSNQLGVTPFLVPHRDEYTETVGFTIKSNSQKAIFIPDIDKWEKFEPDINQMIRASDHAFLDATFYQDGEIKGRAMSEIPHPFVMESMSRFSTLETADRRKVHFIHFNHTNPLLQQNSEARRFVTEKHFRIAEQGAVIKLK